MADWRELLPAAFLLTGSDAAARDLLVRGAGRGGGVDGLLRAHLRRGFAGDAVLTGAAPAPWWMSPADAAAAAELSAALATLSRAERAAVVLRWFEQLAPAEVAARVPGVDLAGLPHRLGVTPAELPARLELLAGAAQQADLDDDVVARGVRAGRARRRRRLLLGAAVVALLAGSPWLPRTVPDPDPPVAAVPADPPRLGEQARGSLSDDLDLVDALRTRLSATSDEPRLVYAGDGLGHRWVLLVATAGPDRTDVHWFTGPRGGAAADLVETSAGFGGDLPPAWSIVVTDRTGTTMIVVGQDHDGVGISSGVDVAPDGRVTRRFVPHATLDGVVTVPLDRPGGTGAQYRVERGGRAGGTGVPLVAGAGSPVELPTTGPRSGVGPVDPLAAAVAVRAVTGPTGRDAADLDLLVLGAGSYPVPGGHRAQVVTVAATLPGGAVVTSTAWATPDGDTQVCGTQVHAAGTAPSTLAVVTRCAVDPGGAPPTGTTLVVVAPPGARVVLAGPPGSDPVLPGLDRGWAALADGGDRTAFGVDGVGGQIPDAGHDPLQGA